MGGLKDWWDKLMGKGDKEDAKEAGLSEPSDESANDYMDMKGDQYVEQRDPGIMHMGQGDE